MCQLADDFEDEDLGRKLGKPGFKATDGYGTRL